VKARVQIPSLQKKEEKEGEREKKRKERKMFSHSSRGRKSHIKLPG
jgi:hypothetical protein